VHGLQLIGKRLFIRTRQEVDDGANLYERIKAVVPKPELPTGKKAIIPSNTLRIPFETPSKPLRNLVRTTRAQRAPA
jgi:hypothetical protein